MEELECRTEAWELEVKCPSCGHWLYAQNFLNTGECVNCKKKFNFWIEDGGERP